MSTDSYAIALGQVSSSSNSSNGLNMVAPNQWRESKPIERGEKEIFEKDKIIEDIMTKTKQLLFVGHDFLRAPTDPIPFPSYMLPLDEDTKAFIKDRGLRNQLLWLHAVADRFFKGAGFEIELLPSGEDEEPRLAMIVYSSFAVSEFSAIRFQLCQAMQQAGHNELYKSISIFQRRVSGNGWQAISLYRQITAG